MGRCRGAARRVSSAHPQQVSELTLWCCLSRGCACDGDARSLSGSVLGTHRLPSQSRLPWVPLKHSKGIKGFRLPSTTCSPPRLSPVILGVGTPTRDLFPLACGPPQTFALGAGGQEHTYLWSSHPTEAWGALEDME